MSLPKTLLRIEGLAVGLATGIGYFYLEQPAWLFFTFILAPDIGMLGYLLSPKVGSWTYNLLHISPGPIILGCAGALFDSQLAVNLALIWATHVGLDRGLGFGLKYPTHFKDTHLQRL